MKNRKFSKFCGITNIEDALIAQKLGCNALGFVFVKSSKRYISPENCQYIIQQLNPNILTVALFADNTVTEISDILKQCSVHVLQFHGTENEDFCSQWHKPYWKAIPMADGINPREYAQRYQHAQAYIVDNYGSGKSAGSGILFDWNKIPQDIDNKWILAGGLNPENIHKAATETQFLSFDVSSGIEQYPGKKCQHKMKLFLKNLNKK